MKRGITIAVVLFAGLLPAQSALAATSSGVQHLHFKAGPYKIVPGANQILTDYNGVPKPTEDGYITRIAPNLRYAKPDGSCCGAIPRVDVIHLHHGVWLSNGAAGNGDHGFSGFYPFFAAGEEKTIFSQPPGYGYPVGRKDSWVLNYMIHDLTATGTQVYITYDVDFIPATAPAAQHIKSVHPIWMDVEAGHIYPVFDVKRYSGRNGSSPSPTWRRTPTGTAGRSTSGASRRPERWSARAGTCTPAGCGPSSISCDPGRACRPRAGDEA